ncbi:MAG: hypothetical protein HUJ31_15340, partial [Pseudomonadales bacterium]|nr:hypothetical protein [Pseudomonadales bacterium]
MKSIFFTAILFLATSVQATFEMRDEDNRIVVEVEDERLGTVLVRVSEHLGLDRPDFSRVHPGEIVSVSVRGDAEAVLHRLLRNYNYIFKYDQEGQLKGLTILGRKSANVGPVDERSLPQADAAP